MYKCPHCGEETISAWNKSKADFFSPAQCPLCGGACYVSIKYRLRIVYPLILFGVVMWAAVIFTGSAWPLVVFPPLLFGLILHHVKKSTLVRKR